MVAVGYVRFGVAFLLAAAAGPAMAAQPSGSAIAVVQAASIDGQSGKQVLQQAAPVFSGDRIDTDTGGSAQIIFRDNTKLVVGPNSSLVIDAFIFGGDRSAQKFSIDAVKGAFRFITGDSPKNAYAISTPTATIGVRGTEFDVVIEREGTTRIANFEGTTRICRRGPNGQIVNPGKDCVESSQPCTLSVIRPTDRDVVKYDNKDVEYRNRQLDYYFPYVRDQSGLLDAFKVNVAQCKQTQTPPTGGSPGSPGTPPGPPAGPPPAWAPTFGGFASRPGTPDFGGRDHDRGPSDHGPVLR